MNVTMRHTQQRASRLNFHGLILGFCIMVSAMSYAQDKPRARDLGIPFEGTPGPLNAITDVAGVEVGFATIIEGEGPLVMGKGPARTGVTAILPRGKRFDPVFAGIYSLNGNGEMTGTHWVEESGFLESPITITNTHSVGTVRDAVIQWMVQNQWFQPIFADLYWLMPVVAETYDGFVNDINGFHVKQEHVFAALDGTSSWPVAEGNVGGGTGMMLHLFKGGTGTASRKLTDAEGAYTVGVLVQTNYGDREDLTVAGIPVGKAFPDLLPESRSVGGAPTRSNGSIIVVVATDAPLLPHQLKRLARRVPMGIAKTGGIGSNYDGDIFIAFSTANPGVFSRAETVSVQVLPNDHMDPLLKATIWATEEAIINALVAAETLTGRDGNTFYAIPHDRLLDILKQHKRLVGK